ncbi:V-type proton ATPase subunit D isoform X1 [Plutella xylostella]|uniref:V-type proton ATPase subunit D isoform X1 n=1 Tax=Plutella xylostella TaxID=51655 RepID=UPI0020328741|nr:V-type proton ATPase subunit D isoform X1 [Plutella xylostella]
MNAENRYPVTASLYMLREIKRRQEQVNRGYQLLKRKTEALRFRGRQVASELASTQAILGHTLREAYISLAAVKFANGESNAMVLENVDQAQVRVHRVTENISGVTSVSLLAVEDPTASDSLRYAGLGAGGHRTSEAKKEFREVLRILVKFASLRNMCLLLDAAIKSTLRKVKGIEKVILPKLKNTETYILMEMDEREREEFHRLKMMKAKKVRNRAICEANAEGCDSGESIASMTTMYSILSREVSFSSNTTISPMLQVPASTPTDSGSALPFCYSCLDDDDVLF